MLDYTLSDLLRYIPLLALEKLSPNFLSKNDAHFEKLLVVCCYSTFVASCHGQRKSQCPCTIPKKKWIGFMSFIVCNLLHFYKTRNFLPRQHHTLPSLHGICYLAQCYPLPWQWGTMSITASMYFLTSYSTKFVRHCFDLVVIHSKIGAAWPFMVIVLCLV